jgi:LacI family transcriptional regulator
MHDEQTKPAKGSATASKDKPATINDVAQLAGVSVGTVSNVLNNRSTVSAARRDRVLRAIEDLGFSGSMLARGMRGQSNSLVGLCVPHTGFANLAALADTLDERSVSANYELIQVLSRYDSKRELSRIRRLIAYRAAGLIIVPGLEPQAVLDLIYQAKLPTVIINRLVADERRFDQVTINHEKAIIEVTQHLLDNGHKSIALALQFPALSVTRQRLEGLSRTVESKGNGATWSTIECGLDRERFHDIFERAVLGKSRPSAVIASNSTVASWIIRSLRQLGIRYPDDISIVCLEDPEWAILVEPQITCIQQPTREIGRIAWDLLMSRIEGTGGEPVVIRCDGRLNLRSSVTPPAS